MNEPYLSQERLIKEHIKYHENEIERLHESLEDISYNSTMKKNSRIDEEVPQRVVYGLDKNSPHNNALAIQGLTSIVNGLSNKVSTMAGKIENAEQLINLVATQTNSLPKHHVDSGTTNVKDELTIEDSFRAELDMSGNKILDYWEKNL